MAFAFGQSAGGQNTSANPSVSFASTPTNGRLLVIVFQSLTLSVAGVTLPAGYTARVAQNDSNGGCLIIADRIAASTGQAQTLTAASSAWDMIILEFSGVAASDYFQTATFTDYGNISNPQPGSITPVNSSELLIAAARRAAIGFAESADSGFTVEQAAPVDHLIAAYKIKSNATAENPTLSWSSASECAAGMVAYSTTSLGGAASLRDRHLPRGVERGLTRGVT